MDMYYATALVALGVKNVDLIIFCSAGDWIAKQHRYKLESMSCRFELGSWLLIVASLMWSAW